MRINSQAKENVMIHESTFTLLLSIFLQEITTISRVLEIPGATFTLSSEISGPGCLVVQRYDKICAAVGT